MINNDPIKNIETAALNAGLRLEEVFIVSKVAFSNHSRWKNKKTSPNTSTLQRLQNGLEYLLRQKIKRKR